MDVQIIQRDGEPEYAVLPWAAYQALLRAAGHTPQPEVEASGTPSDRVTMARLGELREQHGMSLEELARSVGISPSYLALIECGERDPDAAIRRALARVFGIPGWEGEA
jgi:DNA-binding XRE family transcriptional regulator